MATKVDPAVAKQRQQKMILIFGGVILAGLLALQGPKLMKQLNGKSTSSSAAPASTTPTTTTPTTTPTTTGTAPTTTPTGSTTLPAVKTGGTSGPAAEVAGVVLRLAGAPSAGTGQLYSFSSFKVKDPFVQQTKGSSSLGTGTTATKTPSPGTTGTGSTTGSPVATPTTASPVALAYATLMVNGKPQQLQLKQVFPKGQPTFVLTGVDKKSVKIGVAGGKFTGGGVVKLELGKPITVMNTTTGQRFVMKLVFTGSQPEQIAGFKPAAPAGQTTTTSTQTTTASTQSTTASTP